MSVAIQPTISIEQIAAQISGEVYGDQTLIIHGANTLDKAGSGELSYLADAAFLPLLPKTQASAVLVSRNLHDKARSVSISATLLIVEDAKRSFIEFLMRVSPAQCSGSIGIAPDAFVHSTAMIGDQTDIYPGARIGENVVVGNNCTIHSGVCLGSGARIGNGTTLHPNVVLYPGVTIGERVIIHAGAVIGADGFGYQQIEGRHEKIPHFGNVLIEDEVEIGANSTIDRAFLGATIIGRGTKIDNLVHIAHNCELGMHNLLAAQVGLAGSVTTGNYVMFGGQSGVTPHIHLGDKTMLAAQAGVTKSTEGGTAYYGTPAQPHLAEHKQITAVRKLPEMREKLRELAAQIHALETQMQTHAELLQRAE